MASEPVASEAESPILVEGLSRSYGDKRALDNDEGLNTGGMGAYAPAPCVTPDLQKQIEAMCITTVEKMAERGTPYVGLLYAGMM